MKKRLICTFLCCAFIFALLVPASADDNSPPHIYTNEELMEIQNTNAKIDEYMQRMRVTRRINNVLGVPLYQQEETFSCGAATTKMLLAYITGIVHSESYLRDVLGTTEDGTGIDAMQRFIVERVRAYEEDYSVPESFSYQVANTGNTNFSNSVIYSIDNQRPMIFHVLASRLPAYGGTGGGHYLTGTGYSYNSAGTLMVHYNDCNWRNAYYGRYSVTASEMENAIAGRYGNYLRVN